MRHPWLPAALILIGLCVAAPGLLRAQGQQPGDVGFAYGDLKEVSLRGRIVPLQEEMARKYGAKVPMGQAGGAATQWALVLPEGRIYTFLETDAYRKLIGSELVRKAVEVKARHFPRSMLLELLSAEPIDAELLRRRFFCPICTIYTQEYGPCACCGKEMELLRDPQ